MGLVCAVGSRGRVIQLNLVRLVVLLLQEVVRDIQANL